MELQEPSLYASCTCTVLQRASLDFCPGLLARRESTPNSGANSTQPNKKSIITTSPKRTRKDFTVPTVTASASAARVAQASRHYLVQYQGSQGHLAQETRHGRLPHQLAPGNQARRLSGYIEPLVHCRVHHLHILGHLHPPQHFLSFFFSFFRLLQILPT